METVLLVVLACRRVVSARGTDMQCPDWLCQFFVDFMAENWVYYVFWHAEHDGSIHLSILVHDSGL